MSARFRKKFGSLSFRAGKGRTQESSNVAQRGGTSRLLGRVNTEEEFSISAIDNTSSLYNNPSSEYTRSEWGGLVLTYPLLHKDLELITPKQVEAGLEEASNQNESQRLGDKVRRFMSKLTGRSTTKDPLTPPDDQDEMTGMGDAYRSRYQRNYVPDNRGSTIRRRAEEDMAATERHNLGLDGGVDTSLTVPDETPWMSQDTILGRGGALPNRCDSQSRFTEDFEEPESSNAEFRATEADELEAESRRGWAVVETDYALSYNRQAALSYLSLR